MNFDYGDMDQRSGSELKRVHLLNRTLETENDFLRDEIDQLRHRVSCRLDHRYSDERLVGLNGHAGNYQSIDVLEQRYDALTEENRRLRLEASQRTPSKLRPVNDQIDDEEVNRLRTEVKKLREVIDKLSKSAMSPSKSKSPSPCKANYENLTLNKDKNRHDLYYDRSTPESRATIERQQTMYAGMTG